ncbi:unnamed protein product [Microthlaspi erraticum]|uniref:Uncharacterized protein n=1 Tax=Microthlaspi erraticum TaxID=1685480 RepID=A0A6D2JPX3_9BRAS|nr:unnamed protein product [Microthlaspi erraticum]
MHCLSDCEVGLMLISMCPPKNWEAGRGLERADGHQERSTRLGSPHSIELAAPLFFFFIFKVCVASLGLGGAWLARTVHRGSIYSGDAPGKVLDRTQIPDLTKAPPGQLDRQLDRVEFPLFDSIESGGRAGASGLGSLLLLCVLSFFPWRKKRLCEALGQGAFWSGEE